MKDQHKFICITNRNLVKGDFLSWLLLILDCGVNGLPAPDWLILREKDLTPEIDAGLKAAIESFKLSWN